MNPAPGKCKYKQFRYRVSVLQLYFMNFSFALKILSNNSPIVQGGRLMFLSLKG